VDHRQGPPSGTTLGDRPRWTALGGPPSRDSLVGPPLLAPHGVTSLAGPPLRFPLWNPRWGPFFGDCCCWWWWWTTTTSPGGQSRGSAVGCPLKWSSQWCSIKMSTHVGPPVVTIQGGSINCVRLRRSPEAVPSIVSPPGCPIKGFH
jgi:hypothetical protein